jgi:hypothetical protein
MLAVSERSLQSAKAILENLGMREHTLQDRRKSSNDPMGSTPNTVLDGRNPLPQSALGSRRTVNSISSPGSTRQLSISVW